MEQTEFKQLSSEDKCADIKSRIENFKHQHPKLYPELLQKQQEMLRNGNRLASFLPRR